MNKASDLEAVARLAQDFVAARRDARVVAGAGAAGVAEHLADYDFTEPRDLAGISRDMFGMLGSHAVRSDHPRYFGLFNPPALTSAIAGDLIAATINPQLAVWSHAPAAAEIERKLIEFFCSLVWPGEPGAGTFTSGGTEANHTALLMALARRYPEWTSRGLRAAATEPVIYASRESHLAWIKIARSVGLGSDAVRLVPVEDGLRMTAADLVTEMQRHPHADPVLVVATAGTTAHGAVDDLAGIAAVAARSHSHFHVDAAWAGGGILLPDVRSILVGIELADSVTIDPHKWLAVPMGSGMLLARDWELLARAFSVHTSYMPSASLERRDAYIHSLQWSRRFIGLKLFVAMATEGVKGYRRMIQRQMALGDLLHSKLRAAGWEIRNDSPLPLVCFVPGGHGDGPDQRIRDIERHVAESGEAWISSVGLLGKLVLRACITSFETDENDLATLLRALDAARFATETPA